MRSLAARVLHSRLARWARARGLDAPIGLEEAVAQRWEVLPGLMRVGVLAALCASTPFPFATAASPWARLPVPGVPDRWLDVTASAAWVELTCASRGVDVLG